MGSHYCHLKLDERRKLAKWLGYHTPAEIFERELMEIQNRLE